MYCIVKPEFTKAKIRECRKCKWASARIKWCGKWGCWIQGYPGYAVMARSFVKASVKQRLAGNPIRSEKEIEKIKAICEVCDFYVKDRRRCLKCGCKMEKKIPWETTSCLIGKW